MAPTICYEKKQHPLCSTSNVIRRQTRNVSLPQTTTTRTTTDSLNIVNYVSKRVMNSHTTPTFRRRSMSLTDDNIDPEDDNDNRLTPVGVSMDSFNAANYSDKSSIQFDETNSSSSATTRSPPQAISTNSACSRRTESVISAINENSISSYQYSDDSMDSDYNSDHINGNAQAVFTSPKLSDKTYFEHVRSGSHNEVATTKSKTSGLLGIAIKTIKLVQRNKLLQRRLLQLQRETSEFIQSVLANPENRHFHKKSPQTTKVEKIKIKLVS